MKARILSVAFVLLCCLCSWADAGDLQLYYNGSSWQQVASPAGSAEAENTQFFEDNGKLFFLWKENNSIQIISSSNGGMSWSNPKSILQLEGIENVKVFNDQNTMRLIYQMAGDIYYISSGDGGRSFSIPITLNRPYKTTLNADIALVNGALTVVFASEDKFGQNIYLVKSLDGGRSWGRPEKYLQKISVINELLLTKNGVCFVESSADGSYRLYSGQDLLLTESRKIGNLKTYDTDLSLSLIKYDLYMENGAVEPRFISPVALGERKFVEHILGNAEYIDAIYDQGKLYSFFSINDEIKKYEYTPPAVEAPVILTPKPGQKMRPDSLNIAIAPATGVTVLEIDDRSIYFSSGEAVYSLKGFKDGEHFLRGRTFDGAAYSGYTDKQAFSVDSKAPDLFTNLPPEGATINDANFTVSGFVSEEAVIKINGLKTDIDPNMKFSSRLNLVPGENIITVMASDEAGNTSLLTRKVILNESSPVITQIKPVPSQWFMPSSSVVFEARVSDNQKDLDEETEVTITCDGTPLEHYVYYQPQMEKLTGLVPLPVSLSDGRHSLTASLADAAGNSAVSSLYIQIDSLAPGLSKQFKDGIVLCEKKQMAIPFEEKGSGIDIVTSIIKLRDSASMEVKGNLVEKDGGIFFVPEVPLKLGTYKLEVCPRDMAGNVGKTSMVKINISDSNVAAAASSLDVNTVKLEYGPNPFNPAVDPYYLIHYELSSAMKAKLYIFDLRGLLVYMKDLGNVIEHDFHWDGKNAFGEALANGVYPFVLLTEGANREVKRGKIVILR
ncbi:MAG: hypothetical protein KKH83_01675 [Candidatus Margulisbacteria bacterium]|nr:hypothetical protein [Candidatus Margulisiibacteriota bacterium]